MEILKEGNSYKSVPTFAERVDFPPWRLSHSGPVVALSASDDYDGTGYIDYVISGGSNGYCHLWNYDSEGTQTYRLFAKMYHDPIGQYGRQESYRVNKRMDKQAPVRGNAVVSCAAAPRCCLTGTQDGRIFAWLLRDEAEHGQKMPPLSLECLLSGCASAKLFYGILPVPISIELIDTKRNVFGVVGHVFDCSIVILQVAFEGREISFTILHALPTDQDHVMSVARVPGHPSMLVACGSRFLDGEAAKDTSKQKVVNQEDGSVSFLKVWKMPHPGNDNDAASHAIEVLADAELPLGEIPVEIVVSAKRKKFGGFKVKEIHEALEKPGLADDLKNKGMLDETGIIPQDKIHECVAYLYGRQLQSHVVAVDDVRKFVPGRTSVNLEATEKVKKSNVDEFLLGLGLRAYSDAVAGEESKGLPLELFKDTVRFFPEQLIITAGNNYTFTTELRRRGNDYSLKMLPHHHSRKDVNFMAADTVGKNAVTVEHHLCEVWPLDDFGYDSGSGRLKMRVAINELANPCKVTAPLCVASTARGKDR
jgi:hypothetical protein